MADQTHIEWTDATWNIVTGCSVVSPGCTNCYAMKLAGTRLQHHPSRAGLTIDTKAGPVWNGQVRFNADWLDQPLRWTKPRRIFVAAHGDLFHDGVTDDQLDQIFAVMALCPQHTFQVLTKRPERMRAYLTDAPSQVRYERRKRLVWATAYDVGGEAGAEAAIRAFGNTAEAMWPLPNVWLGVSVEDQTRADERIPALLDTPAAVRWISAEPLLGPVDVPRFLRATVLKPASCGKSMVRAPLKTLTPALDWVVVGGESGPGARPMHPDWARQLREQCAAAGVAFLFKQWGAWAPTGNTVELGGGSVAPFVAWPDGQIAHGIAPDHGGPGVILRLTGKKAAGRLLDGVLHDGYPGARS